MLCRKKLVLFLTLTTLGLMYISANHYLSADNSGKTTSSPSTPNNEDDLVKAPPLHTVMNKKTQLEKYLQPVENNVEFRTANPIPTGKKLGKYSKAQLA